MSELLRRLRFLLHRKQFERELEEEFQHHLAMKGENAQKQFGNIALLKEESRRMWRSAFWEQLAQDIRYGIRAMSGNKLFTAMAILSLALGIGANTAIYSFMDAIMLRALPVRDPERLVIFNWHAKQQPDVIRVFYGGGHQDPKTGFTSGYHPYPALELLRAHDDVLESLFTFSFQGRANLIFAGQAGLANGEFVSGTYFGGLGALPAAGRLIGADDDRPGAPPVTVLSNSYWRSRFAADPGVIGKTVLINNSPYVILGAAAPGFYGETPGNRVDFFMPIHLIPDPRQRRFTDARYYWVGAMARVRPGVSMARAHAALAPAYDAFIAGTASSAAERANLPRFLLQEGGSGVDSLRRQYSRPLAVLMTMVGLILAIACANIANLLLARSAYRRREIAVRLSLGASRLRVVRQLLTESLLLSLAGGAGGVLIAIPGIRLIAWLLANGREDFHLDAALDWRVLAFSFGLALLTGIVFGLAPAMQSTKIDVTPALKETRGIAGRTRRIGLGRVLVVSQIAFSLVLVTAASLFVRTLSNLESLELGFDREHILLFSMQAAQEGYAEAGLVRFYDALLARFRAVPRVRAASLSDFALVSGAMSATGVSVPGGPVPTGRDAGTDLIYVGPSFFSTMRLPVLRGREIEQHDVEGAQPVAVINEVLARKYFPNQDPVGHRIGIGGDGGRFVEYEVIGVAKAARYNTLKRDIPPVTYLSIAQHPRVLNYVVFELRTIGDPLSLANAVRQIAHDADPRVPLFNITTQAAQIDRTISQERTFADLCTCFAVLALLISCVGLYGSMAYAVARRTGEIGIRMALGARRWLIVRMVLREVVLLSGAGLAIGFAIAWNLSHFVESFLFQMKPNDPTALSIALATLAAAALIAGYAPAWRASKIDPMEALRHE